MGADLVYSAWLGFLAGLLPVYLGLLALPAFRAASERRRRLLLGFTIGILLFLFADVTHEALQGAQASAPGPLVYSLALLAGLLAPMAVAGASQTSRHAEGVRERGVLTAYLVALGIGLHNFGEGLAIGAAYTAGQLALTTLLVIGFALHNGTEGMGIAGPMVGAKVSARDPVLMGFVAGAPTILGSVVGSLAFSTLLAVAFFSAASGAILYVVIELARLAYQRPTAADVLSTALGILLMFGTGLLLQL
ncbi:MAG: zinc transporter ZupT [Nitrososphaerota archaeon]